jgi:hypothetical protein
MSGAYETEDLNRRFGKISERLGAIEAQLALLSERAGVPYGKPLEEMPPEVIQLVQAGKQLEAIKLYRELSGASMDVAREAIAGI